MANRRDSSSKSQRPPAKSPEGRELQMIALAVDAAEKQLRDGTASSQLITHYLKLGSSREKLEQEKLAKENDLLEAKKEALASTSRLEELMADAIKAFSVYRPTSDVVSGEIEYDYDD